MKLDATAFLEHARAKGLTWTERAAKPLGLISGEASEIRPSEPVAVPLLTSTYASGVWVVGVETRSETNKRSWKDRNRRTIAARKAVSWLFGRTLAHVAPFAAHYHAGKPLRVVFTRLAPHRLDRGNVSPALKAVEDAVALYLGADDGDDRWQAEYGQEHNPKIGVRVMMEAVVLPVAPSA